MCMCISVCACVWARARSFAIEPRLSVLVSVCVTMVAAATAVLFQAILWSIWSPWWSLALTGGLVGMVTDQLALNLIFLPVEPKRIGPFTLQGLFLKRQAQVSAEFSEFVVDNVLTAEKVRGR